MPTDMSQYGRVIAYCPDVARIAGSVEAGLLLSQLIFWSDKTKDGWVYKTAEQFEDELYVSRPAQAAARAALRERGLIDERLRGMPGKMHFLVNFDRLKALLAAKGELVPLDPDAVIDSYGPQLDKMARAAWRYCHKMGLTTAQRIDYRIVVRRDGGICQCCQQPIPFFRAPKGQGLVIDHKVPISKGGQHTLDNLQCSHSACGREFLAEDTPVYDRIEQQVLPDTCPPILPDTCPPILPQTCPPILPQTLNTEITAESTTEKSSTVPPASQSEGLSVSVESEHKPTNIVISPDPLFISFPKATERPKDKRGEEDRNQEEDKKPTPLKREPETKNEEKKKTTNKPSNSAFEMARELDKRRVRFFPASPPRAQTEILIDARQFEKLYARLRESPRYKTADPERVWTFILKVIESTYNSTIWGKERITNGFHFCRLFDDIINRLQTIGGFRADNDQMKQAPRPQPKREIPPDEDSGPAMSPEEAKAALQGLYAKIGRPMPNAA